MINKVKRLLGIPSPSRILMTKIEVTNIVIDHEAVKEAVEQARKREIWERQNLPYGA
jgi:hypothetical protein